MNLMDEISQANELQIIQVKNIKKWNNNSESRPKSLS